MSYAHLRVLLTRRRATTFYLSANRNLRQAAARGGKRTGDLICRELGKRDEQVNQARVIIVEQKTTPSSRGKQISLLDSCLQVPREIDTFSGRPSGGGGGTRTEETKKRRYNFCK